MTITAFRRHPSLKQYLKDDPATRVETVVNWRDGHEYGRRPRVGLRFGEPRVMVLTDTFANSLFAVAGMANKGLRSLDDRAGRHPS